MNVQLAIEMLHQWVSASTRIEKRDALQFLDASMSRSGLDEQLPLSLVYAFTLCL
jgi:hypothetical protein